MNIAEYEEGAEVKINSAFGPLLAVVTRRPVTEVFFRCLTSWL